jgi:hypothetical protein
MDHNRKFVRFINFVIRFGWFFNGKWRGRNDEL